MRLTLEDFEAVARCQRYFSEYTLLVRKGQGAQGAVYSAVQDRTGRRVAIKLLESTLVSERQRQRFLREIDLISRLRHPHIVTIYDFSVVDDHPYYTMDLISGMNILDHVAVMGLDVRDTTALFLRVLDALAHAHRYGVIHRDLKPSNILVNESNCPFVLDFGLAKAVSDPDDGVSDACVVVGTIPYMSPEQSLGAEPDALSDVYALAVMLFELLTGHLPFDTSGSREAVLDRMRNRPPRRFEDALADDPARLRAVPRDLRSVVYKALAKSPTERYQSVAALAQDLRRWMNAQAVEARAEQSWYVLRKAAQRYRGLIASALLVVGVVGVMFWQRLEMLETARQVQESRLEALESARRAQASLQMSAYIKLASVQRDEGRVQDAANLLSDAVLLGESLTTPDAESRRFLFDAHHRLAEMLISKRLPAQAEPHATAAMEIARAQYTENPEDEEWQRYLGFAHRVAASLALGRKKIHLAKELAQECVEIRGRLVMSHPENHSMRREHAVALGLLGRCCGKDGELGRAWSLHSESHSVLTRLSVEEPHNSDTAMEVLLSRFRLAVWHMRHRTLEQDIEADRLFNEIIEVASSDLLRNRALEFKTVLDSSKSNLEKLEERVQKYALQTPPESEAN